MPIVYDRLIDKMKEHGFTSFTAKTTNIIGQGTYKKIMNGDDVKLSTLEKLCKYLDCDPSEVIEYRKE